MAKRYELPAEEKASVKEAYDNFLIAEDLLKRLRNVGEPNAEAEVRVRELKRKAKRFADEFEVDLEE